MTIRSPGEGDLLIGAERVYVTSLVLQNVQSYKYVEFNFTPGLNVFVGDNSAGKSIAFKMIKLMSTWGTRLHKKVEFLVRRNEDFGIALFTLSDGSMGGVRFAKGLIQYLYQPAGAATYTVSTRPILEFLQRAGIIVDGNFILNLLDSDQELLLVNSNVKTNASLINLIAFNEDLDCLISNSGEQLGK